MAISAPMAGAPGMEIVAPCVCSDWTRCVLALTAATASLGLGSAEKAIGGASPLRRSQAWDRQPGAAHKAASRTRPVVMCRANLKLASLPAKFQEPKNQ